jgi:hypothetical protein
MMLTSRNKDMLTRCHRNGDKTDLTAFGWAELPKAWRPAAKRLPTKCLTAASVAIRFFIGRMNRSDIGLLLHQ